MGFLGIQLGNLLISWEVWDYPGSGRYQMLGIILFGGFYNIYLSFWYSNIDFIS